MLLKIVPAAVLTLGVLGVTPANATIESFSCEPLEFTMGAFKYKFFDCIGGESDGESNGIIDHVIKEANNGREDKRPLEVLYNPNDKGTEQSCELFEKPLHPVRAMTEKEQERYQNLYELLLQLKAEQEIL